MGWVPVSILGLSLVVSAVIGVGLSEASSAWSVAADLGCADAGSSQPQAGVRKETCSYHGNTIVILSLSHGQHAFYPRDLPDNVVIGPRGKDVVIGCESREDCVTIQKQLGGHLTSGPTLGLSLVVG